jgi:hypothetical protein
MIPLDHFTAAMEKLCSAFGRELNEKLVVQYHAVLGTLSEDQLDALVSWAVETLDTTFPTIACLRNHALDEGYLGAKEAPRTEKETHVEVTCPKCDGRFMVRKSCLMADARAGRVYRCTNYRHWGCTMTFSAASIAALLHEG